MRVVVTEGDASYFRSAHPGAVQQGENSNVTYRGQVPIPSGYLNQDTEFIWFHVPTSGQPRVRYTRDVRYGSVSITTREAATPALPDDAPESVQVLVDGPGSVVVYEFEANGKDFSRRQLMPGEGEGVVTATAEPRGELF